MTRTLIRGATLVTMEARNGDPCGVMTGDLLVDRDRIAAIGAKLDAATEASGATVIDADGFIVTPGFINAHMHTWQTALRGVAAGWTLTEYFRQMHAGLATRFTPEDIHIATLAGAWNQLDCGTTTLVDWCHNNPTPAHSDAAIDALQASGIRAAFFHGSPKPDPRPGVAPFWETPHPRAEVERIARRLQGHALVSLGLAILGPHYSTMDVALHDFRLAKEFGLIASMHQGGGAARTPEGWDRLEAAGLLGPHINIVHGNNLTDAQLARFVDAGMSFSVTPENELTQGHGFPITGRLRALGAAPSLGVDLESGLSGEMFIAARMALGVQRALDHAEYRNTHDGIAAQHGVSVADALSWITVEGARMLGLADRIGSLAPGKQADLVMIDARRLNMFPLHDPVSAVVMQASLANIDSVFVAGVARKRHGTLLADGLPSVLATLRASGERLLQDHTHQ
ncbi:amidohydrolase family protein [Cupriavidus plantarum]|uniref:amidohydrolase family protein n=1 Tax=Cupriavidus plantarum TaxID=942865 RepID=UPI001B2AEE2A|nr:amidohydrolase family protein [Cupriavidus plantarum]CAG2138496.1 8-oxoguanine deaminase [Cupriavidus plantarum]SMR85866.1 Cytosine/adenosine deaminase [Cupriavidus plantarum]